LMNLAATLNVVDLAKYQDPNSLDWQGMVNAGVKAVIIQLSHGTVYEDYAREHIAKAQSVGLIVHGYHYYQGETGEVDFSISNAISLGLPKSSYMFLDFEDTSISGDWGSQANDFFTAWKQAGWKAGLYTGGSLYKSKFNNDSLVNSGIYRWIAAYGTNDGTAQYGYEPANYDAWQYTSSGGIGSYTGALDKSYDKTGKLITVGSTPITLDPYEPATPTAGAYVGTGIDTTGLGGGRAYGYSTGGNSFYSALTPFGFIFREIDADRMWTLIKPKIGTIQGAKGDKGDKGDTGAQGTQGTQGATGPIGATGPQGDKGDTGLIGPQGPQGEKGDTGAQGPQGIAGKDGAKGDTGAQGPQGANGQSIWTYPYDRKANRLGSWWSDLKPTPTTANPPKVGDTIIDLIGNMYQITNVVVGGADEGGGTFDYGDPLTNIKGSKGDTGAQGPQSNNILDTDRVTNWTPTQCLTNWPAQTVQHFKNTSSLGITMPNGYTSTYCVLTTKVPGNNAGFGGPIQTAEITDAKRPFTFKRVGISTTDWSAWELMTTW
jgi:GH25 family lysozyme M1 (1,4-beta-N-acetylmuramidase)